MVPHMSSDTKCCSQKKKTIPSSVALLAQAVLAQERLRLFVLGAPANKGTIRGRCGVALLRPLVCCRPPCRQCGRRRSLAIVTANRVVVSTVPMRSPRRAVHEPVWFLCTPSEMRRSEVAASIVRFILLSVMALHPGAACRSMKIRSTVVAAMVMVP